MKALRPLHLGEESSEGMDVYIQGLRVVLRGSPSIWDYGWEIVVYLRMILKALR